MKNMPIMIHQHTLSNREFLISATSSHSNMLTMMSSWTAEDSKME